MNKKATQTERQAGDNSPAGPSKPGITYLLLIALLTSIGALATDIMLPALGVIGADLSVMDMNATTLIVTAFFFGMAMGQLVVGPFSDRFGRKPVIAVGYILFITGCILSMTAQSWEIMVAARVLQGVGAAAPRTIAIAIVRDEYQGRMMARIMSIVMAVFVLTPILAPLLGQGLMYLDGWRATFAGLIIVAVPSALWFQLTMRETLPIERRRALSTRVMTGGIVEVFRSKQAMVHMLAMGFILGPFVAYLGTARQIYQVTFEVGDAFVLYFAIGSISAGIASLLNARLVMRFGMRMLASSALGGITILSIVLWGWIAIGGVPDLIMFNIWFFAIIFCIGMLFGNLQALAMEPLGHLAGLGAAIVGAGGTFISLPISWMISSSYDGTVTSLVAGFAISASLSLMLVWGSRRNKPQP